MDDLFESDNSPYYWELSCDPYNDVSNKNFSPLKNKYKSMDEYRKVYIYIYI